VWDGAGKVNKRFGLPPNKCLHLNSICRSRADVTLPILASRALRSSVRGVSGTRRRCVQRGSIAPLGQPARDSELRCPRATVSSRNRHRSPPRPCLCARPHALGQFLFMSQCRFTVYSAVNSRVAKYSSTATAEDESLHNGWPRIGSAPLELRCGFECKAGGDPPGSHRD
jgi:hypothetical protein